jgi:hypothetical protein
MVAIDIDLLDKSYYRCAFKISDLFYCNPKWLFEAYASSMAPECDSMYND